jgi:membrane-bound lytic murein transglycosylase D
MFKFITFLSLFWLISTPLFALSLENRYPSYAYVFHEFDVDESYRYDDAFLIFVKRHEKQMKVFYRQSLQRGKEILPTMQGLLLEDGVSDLFIYLSMIESGLVLDAISPKKAVGLWQFMPKTAKQYDLMVCSSYDERCDMQSATQAAVTYLNKLYKQFGKWYLAAMAYNCGEGCVERAITHAGTDELSILADDDLGYLPEETRAYIKKILLVAMIGENQSLSLADMPFDDSSQQVSEAVVQVEMQRDATLKSLAAFLKMDETILLALNEGIREGIVPKNQKITIPIEKVYAFYLQQEQLMLDAPLAKTSHKSHMISHYVSLGESLQSIAKHYDADTQEIENANHLSDVYLSVGQLLVIPVTQATFEKMSQ